MIDGPVGAMLAHNKTRVDHTVPPNLKDRLPEAKRTGALIAAVFCSDPRVDPRKILALDEFTSGPPVAIVRNPGGRATEAIKSLAGLQALLNCGTILVVHHTDCGMTHISDQEVRDHLISIAPEDKTVIENTKFGEITKPFEDTIKEDLAILRASSWIKKSTRLIGLKYDTHTGLLEEVQDLKPQE